LELLEAIKKRTAIRIFSDEPIPDEVLRQMVRAAHKAPTASNTPYRRIMVVTDRKRLRILRQIAPGILGQPTGVMVIYTDLKIAADMGRISQACSTLDAGAAAENACLVATSLGLGSCFTKSYSEAAVKELFGIPDDRFRTEVILQLGYPAATRPPPAKPRKGARITELDKFGGVWN
jgi:nitroreductase